MSQPKALERAAQKAAQRGRRLSLVVDGLWPTPTGGPRRWPVSRAADDEAAGHVLLAEALSVGTWTKTLCVMPEVAPNATPGPRRTGTTVDSR